LIKIASKPSNVIEIMKATCNTLDITNAFFNNQYEIDELRRDAKIEALLSGKGISVLRFDADVLVSPSKLVSPSSGKPYQASSSFRKAWVAYVKSRPKLLREYDPKKGWMNAVGIQEPDIVPLELKGFELSKERRDLMIVIYPVCEHLAMEKLRVFSRKKVENYQRHRNFPDMDGTSGLSPLLSIGLSSPQLI
jgi:deoxyribodipyrimidine photo-lyase